MSRRAVILAGGMGTRLRPYTTVLPKPLMPIGDYPILEVIIRQLAEHGFNHITLAVNHQAELFRAFFADGSRWGVKIDYSLEDKPLSTMAPLRLIKGLPDHFLVMNGDILTDLNFSSFYEAHVEGESIFSISSYHREHKIDYGVLEVNQQRLLSGFIEKPVKAFEVSMGIYMMSKEALAFIPSGEPYGFDGLMSDLLASDQHVAVRAHDGLWLDIGRPDDYVEAIDCFDRLKGQLLNG
jgi:NDP-sugar pyrophosphorylase family protein